MSITVRRHRTRVEYAAKRPAAPAAERPAGPARLLPLTYTLIVALLVIAAASYGLLVDDAYRLVPELTKVTWRAQGAVTLAAVPVLSWTFLRARAGSLRAHLDAMALNPLLGRGLRAFIRGGR